MACEKCAAFDGRWQQTETGLKRCDCLAGRSLAEADKARKEAKSEPPVLRKEATRVIVEMLAAIPFFPSEEGARLLVGEEIRSMCHTPEEGIWLAKRMARLCPRWPGVHELRRVYCSKHRPLDGFELIGPSETFPDGVPPERQIEQQPLLALGAGQVVTAARSIDGAVQDLAEAKRSKNAGRKPLVRPIPIVPPGARVTQADIDAALEANRERAGKEELG